MSPRTPQRQPPPNYFSRRVQLKLMMLVSMFMLVVILMIEAGKPKNWQWMFAGQPPAAESTNPPRNTSPREVGTSDDMAPRGTRETPSPGEPVPATSAATTESPGERELGERGPGERGPGERGPGERGAAQAAAEGGLTQMGVDESDPLKRTLVDGWRAVLEQLSAEHARTLRQGLHAARQGHPWAAEEAEAWEQLLPRLDRQWAAYHDEALASLAEDAAGLNAEQRERWLGILRRSRTTWSERFHPALESVASKQPLGDEQREVLGEIQALLDELALNEVTDNTVLRPADKVAWFRALERLRAADPAALKRASSGPVNYLQLAKQPQVYRGKLVTVRGEARLAYRVTAPKNLYGISGYYIFWLKPAVGPNTPLVVYSLEIPPGFPDIKDKDRDGETTSLQEPVEFTGYFFKRWAYQARDGINTAPLVLARVAEWRPAPSLANRPIELPSWSTLTLVVLAALAVACTIALTAYLRSGGSAAGSWHKSANTEAPDRLRELAGGEHPTPLEATLRQLKETEGN